MADAGEPSSGLQSMGGAGFSRARILVLFLGYTVAIASKVLFLVDLVACPDRSRMVHARLELHYRANIPAHVSDLPREYSNFVGQLQLRC